MSDQNISFFISLSFRILNSLRWQDFQLEEMLEIFSTGLKCITTTQIKVQVELITRVCDSITHLNSVSMMQLFWWQGLTWALGTPSHPKLNPSSRTACVTLPIFHRYACVSYSLSHNQRQTQQVTGWSLVFCYLQVLETPNDLQVFSVMLHTHLTGRKVRVGHFR